MLTPQTTETTNNNDSPKTETLDKQREKIVRALAYELWLERGGPIGSDQEDWFAAERQLRGNLSLAA